MVTMPGTPVETYDPNSSEAAVKPKPPYKPEMGVQVKPGENPYDAFQGDTDLAERANVADVGWKERFTQWFSASQDYGTPGVDELKDIQSAEQGYVNGVGIGPEAGKATADLMRSRRAERQFQFENMKPAETIGDYAAAVSGAVAGAVMDPASALQAPIKIGTTGWRMAYPMLSRLLESGTSNAAMNAAINGVVQAEEFGAGVRDEVDWLSLGVDAAAGFGFGLPFGYADGRAARDFYAREAQAATGQPAAPAEPAAPLQPPEPVQGLDVPTSDQMRAEYTAAELSQAQVDLFGEVVGTRNMTPEQLAQLDDYLNAGKAGDIPQAPPETQGGLTNDVPPPEPAPQPEASQAAEDLSVDPAKYRGEKTPAIMAGGKVFTGERHADALEKAIQTFGADSPEIQAIDADPTAHLGMLNPGGLFSSGEFRPGISGDDGKGVKEAIAAAQPPAAAPVSETAKPNLLKGGTLIGYNADGHEVWDRARADGTRAVRMPDGKVRMETPNLMSGPGFADAGRMAMFEVVTPATPEPRVAPPPPLPIDRTERQFSPSELKVDAKRFQFKEGGDEAGVTDRLKGVKKWDPIKSGVTLVWEDLNGDFYIADGHQRHGLASRLEKDGQDPKIRAVVLREADGVTAEDARAIAAAKNIAEGTGNAIDAAKILRSRPDMGVDLPPTSALVRDAQGLASLSDDAFGMVINKKVPAGYAAQVGRLAPDPKTHAQLLELLAKEQPDNAIEAESMIRDALDAPAVQSTMEDMFGSAEVTQILFKERAQILASAATAIRKDRAAFSTLVKEEARLTGAGNQLATATNAERAAQDAEILATLQAQARRKGPVADALAAAAKRLNAGESRPVVVRDFLDSVRRSGAPTGADGGSTGAAGRAGEEGIAASLGGYRNTDPGIAFSRRRPVASEAPLLNWVSPEREAARQRMQAEMDRIKTLPEDQQPAAANKFSRDMAAGLFDAAPQPKPVERPTSMPERQAAFREEVERLRAEKAELERSIFAAIDKDGAFSAETADGRTIIVTKSLRDPSLYQITNLDRNGEATGHFDSREADLASDVRSTGVKLGGKPRADNAAAPPPSTGSLFDTGADNKPQAVIPGAGKISDKRLAEMRAAAPMRAKRPQKAADIGLFGDEMDQQGFAFSAPAHPLNVQVDVKRAFFASQPARPLDELYGGLLQRRQDDLVQASKLIAEELGITFKNPGIKKRATTEEKIGRKGYTSTAQLSDLVRGGFEVSSPDLAEALVRRLADFFDILDEGWAVTPHGYFDRKIGVRFYDGTIGEVQVWEPQLAYAKMKGGGTELYTASRSMPPGPERDLLEKQMTDLYEPITRSLPPAWAEAVGSGGSSPKLVENASRKAASSGNTLPDSPTSMESTLVQGAPGSRTAQALPTDQSAGRASQSTNLNTETSFQTTSRPGSQAPQDGVLSQGGTIDLNPQQDPLLQPGPWRETTIMAVDETGKAVQLNAGDAVDFMVTRINSLRQLLECVNAG